MSRDDIGIPSYLKTPISATTCSPELSTRLKSLLIREYGEDFSLFPVQATVFSVLKSHQIPSLIVSSATGSGKTLAYVLPSLTLFSERLIPRVRILVIVPTRELALQVKESYNKFASGLRDFRIRVLPTNEICDVVIATPGQLVNAELDFSQIELVIVDEVDRLLGQTYSNWTSVLEAKISGSRKRDYDYKLSDRYSVAENQVKLPGLWLFSATITRNPEKLGFVFGDRADDDIKYIMIDTEKTVGIDDGAVADDNSTEPISTRKYGKYSIPATLEMFLCPSRVNKLTVLMNLLHNLDGRLLIFANSIPAAQNLEPLLSSFNAEFATKRSINRFKRGTIRVLIGCDGLCRGIDFDGKDGVIVINYDVPAKIKTLVHRAGRSARAGRSGACYTIATSSQVKPFKKMMESKLPGLTLKKLRIREE